MIAPAVPDKYRKQLGLPTSEPEVPKQVKYKSEEVDTMPTMKS